MDVTEIRKATEQVVRFRMVYKFGLDEMLTKVNILREEFVYLNRYNPIEHISSRLKSPESILDKLLADNRPITFEHIRESVHDIAGIRITCSFISDTYKVADMLTAQPDVELVRSKDYIANPKPNGYKSLHLIVKIPVFLSDRVEDVFVELQLRTVAMDFWASLEHKIYYKYDGEIPASMLEELKDAADAANRLDVTMEHLHEQVGSLKEHSPRTPRTVGFDEVRHLPLSEEVLDRLLSRGEPEA